MLTSAARRIRRHIASRSRGQSLVEFALILPVFMLFFATTLDLGRLAMAQLSIANAAREGAFQAAVTPASFDSTKECTDGSSNLVVCRVQLEAKASGVTIAPSDISMTCSVSGCPTGMGNRVTVSVVGHFQLLTPILSPFFGSQNITFTKSATNQIETLPTPPPGATPTPVPTATPTLAPGVTPAPTATPVPTITPPPICTLPSAGFTYTVSPSSMSAPVTVTVTDTTTSPNCAITAWSWDWGDLTTTLGQNPGTHTYNTKGVYGLTLKVTNSAGSNTTGKVQIHVQ